MIVLAGGVLVGAVSIYLAASVLPTAVERIGGEELYAWNMTVFLVGQVAAAMLTATVLQRVGSRAGYAAGFGLFAAGSVVCTVAPMMPIMLAGRGVQGLGAGLLTGLGFALIQASLPSSLWSRGSAVISAMFGLGNFIGPAVGGALAQAGAWRWAFALLAVPAVLLGAVALRVLHADTAPRRKDPTDTARPGAVLGVGGGGRWGTQRGWADRLLGADGRSRVRGSARADGVCGGGEAEPCPGTAGLYLPE